MLYLQRLPDLAPGFELRDGSGKLHATLTYSGEPRIYKLVFPNGLVFSNACAYQLMTDLFGPNVNFGIL